MKKDNSSADLFRITIPIKSRAWDELPLSEDSKELLLWFHQTIIDDKMSWAQVTKEVGFSRSTIFRILNATYQADDWGGPLTKIAAFRLKREPAAEGQESAEIKTLRTQEDAAALPGLAKTDAFDRVFGACNYALKHGKLSLIIGQSRMGKTTAAKAWRDTTGKASSIFVEVPPVGGCRALLSELAYALGIGNSSKRSIAELLRRVCDGLSPRRVVIVDEAGRLCPSSGGANAQAIEILRAILDRSGCGMVLLATERFIERASGSKYQFEQLLGRIELPVQLQEFTQHEIFALVEGIAPGLSSGILAKLFEVSKRPGRLGTLTAILTTARHLAKGQPGDLHVSKALAWRRKNMAELVKLF